MRGSLCGTFQELARQTWQRLAASTVTGLPWGEVTNTETLLAELALRHPRSVRLRAMRGREEALNGGDWEWWIGRPGSWLGMRVQAKRLNIQKQAFLGLRRQRPRGAPETQMATLIRQAATDDLTPAYCFYVYSRQWPHEAIWLAQDPWRSSPENCGCLIAHASAVRATGSETLRRVSRVSIPWHYLVCDDDDAVVDYAERTRRILHRSAFSGADEGLLAAPDHADFPLSGLRNELPSYLSALVGRSSEAEDQESDLEAAARQRGLAGYLVINAHPDGVWDQ